MEIIEKVNALLQPLLEGTDIFVVNIIVKPINNIKIFLDADEGLTVEKSAKINRRLYHEIEDSELFPNGDYSLEVSSPGVDEPLMNDRQYKKNIGRTVAVTLNGDDAIETTGVLKEVKDDMLVLEIKALKKKEATIMEIPFSDIKKTVVQIIF